ncbi:MAG: hypothetical protein Q7S75_01370 [bacterium]|nr:hypothetical protein [bacterium]
MDKGPERRSDRIYPVVEPEDTEKTVEEIVAHDPAVLGELGVEEERKEPKLSEEE